MDHHSSRRARSPPFGYDPRPMMNNREFDNPYGSFDGPPRHHPSGSGSCMIPLPGVGTPDDMGLPYIEQTHRQAYMPNYRDRMPSTYRHAVREPYPASGPLSRSASPSYKILCITNINHKIDDSSIKSALMSEFCRYGDISVSICHDSGERLAYIYFRTHEEAREARVSKSRSIFFDRPIDIEPIYEPSGSPTGGPSPIPQMPAMVHPPHAMYPSDNRRSLTPVDYIPSDLNGPALNHRRQIVPPHIPHHAPTPPMSINHRTISPPEYPQSHGAGYESHGTSRSPMGADQGTFDRRGVHKSYFPAPRGMSPFSPPSHEHYKYQQSHQYDSYIGSGPPAPPPSSVGRMGRERVHPDGGYSSSRPMRDPYYSPEHRPPPTQPAHPHRASSRPSNHYPPYPRASPVGHQPANRYSDSATPSVYRHRQQPGSPTHFLSRSQPQNESPMRFMSREFRRERFGINQSHGSDQEDGRPSRVLLVNDIDTSRTESHLRDAFESYGLIEEIEIKRVTETTSSALIRFSSMDGAYKAKSANHGRYIGNSKCSIVYGKVSASRRLWIGGLNSSTTVPSLEDECSKYGDLVNMEYTSGRPYTYVEYETPNQAQFAAHHLRSTLVPAPDRKIRIEFVDPERSEKMSRHDANSNATDNKSRSTNESWLNNDLEVSPKSYVGVKRSSSPVDHPSKRTHKVNDLPLGANTFKQERLVAAAAAKARNASTAPTKIDKTSEIPTDHVELNNNTKSDIAGNGNLQTNDLQVTSESANDSDVQKEAPSLKVLAICNSIRDIVSHSPVSWPTQIALRNFTFPSTIHLCSGRKEIIDKYLAKAKGENGTAVDYPLLKITQRWRLHPQPKLEEVKKRMQSGNLGILIITSRQETPQTESNKHSTCAQQSDPNQSLQNGHHHVGSNALTSQGEALQNSNLIDKTKQEHAEDGSVCGSNNESTINNPTAGGTSVEQINPASSSIDINNATTIQTSQAKTKMPNATSESNTQSRPLRNLISYLEQKDAAGVISLCASDSSSSTGEQLMSNAGSGSDGSPKLLYAFPPGEFALNLIKHMASNLSTEISKEEFLLGVIVGNNVEGRS